MNNELSTEVKTHVIITFTKAHHQITQKQYDAVIQMGAQGQVIVDGNMVKASNISDILTIEKYKETYPEKIPYNYGQPYSSPEAGYSWEEIMKMPGQGFGGVINKIAKRKDFLVKAIENMKKFRERYDVENTTYFKGQGSLGLLRLMEQRLREVEEEEKTQKTAQNTTQNLA